MGRSKDAWVATWFGCIITFVNIERMTIRSTAGCNSVRTWSRPPRCSFDGRTGSSNPPRWSLGACGIFVFIEINQIYTFFPPSNDEFTGNTRRPTVACCWTLVSTCDWNVTVCANLRSMILKTFEKTSRSCFPYSRPRKIKGPDHFAKSVHEAKEQALDEQQKKNSTPPILFGRICATQCMWDV